MFNIVLKKYDAVEVQQTQCIAQYMQSSAKISLNCFPLN